MPRARRVACGRASRRDLPRERRPLAVRCAAVGDAELEQLAEAVLVALAEGGTTAGESQGRRSPWAGWAHRSRQDGAGDPAHRQEHRPSAGGAAARHLDRARVRGAALPGGGRLERRRRPRPRALRAHHGGRRHGHRPLAPGRGRRRRRDAADGRAPGDHRAARRAPRRGGAHQGRSRRRGAARDWRPTTCASSWPARRTQTASWLRSSARDGRGSDALLAALERAAGHVAAGRARTGRPGCRSTACSP